jgi:hypothetical protein
MQDSLHIAVFVKQISMLACVKFLCSCHNQLFLLNLIFQKYLDGCSISNIPSFNVLLHLKQGFAETVIDNLPRISDNQSHENCYC